MECQLSIIRPNDDNFEEMCNTLIENVIQENLTKNGGTLRYQNLIRRSEFLLVAYLNGEPIGYVSIIYKYDSLCVNQIGVKKELQQKGIGRQMMLEILEIAKQYNMDVTAHVMNYNTNSVKLFTGLGFVKLEENELGNGFYRYHEQILDQKNPLGM